MRKDDEFLNMQDAIDRFLYLGYNFEDVVGFMDFYQNQLTFKENLKEFKNWLKCVGDY